MEPNDREVLLCEKCEYSTTNKKDYKKHCKTLKHNRDNTMLSEVALSKPLYMCQLCNKTYTPLDI